MKTASIGMIYDRALTPELLDVGLRVATESGDDRDARRLLTVALRDYVSPQEAEGKTKKCLSRIWVRPPEPTAEMIRWAVEHQDLDVDRSVLHFGAILAAFPFAGAVARLVGRQLHLDGEAHLDRVRSEALVEMGDRSTIYIGARKVVTTMRYLGLLAEAEGKALKVGKQPTVPSELAGWVTHALLLTRQANAIGVDDVPRSFELATLKVGGDRPNGYPLVEIHSEGSRSVITVR